MTHEARLLGRGRITDLAWTPDGRALGLAGSLGIWVYDATNLDAPPRLAVPHDDPLLNLAFSPDGSLIAAGTDGGTVRVWALAEGQEPALRHVFEGFYGQAPSL